jgi:hypothetical protein
VAVASARSSTVSEVTGTLRLALVLDVAGSPSSSSAFPPRHALVLDAGCPGFEFAQPQAVGNASPHRLEWNHPILKPGGGGLKNTVGFLCVYQSSWGRRDSTTGGITPVTKANSWMQKFILFGGIPSDLEDRCDEGTPWTTTTTSLVMST